MKHKMLYVDIYVIDILLYDKCIIFRIIVGFVTVTITQNLARAEGYLRCTTLSSSATVTSLKCLPKWDINKTQISSHVTCFNVQY